MKKAFTLIELLMVIALIAIVSTLAVTKVGGIREASARKVSLANQKAVERAVEAYLANSAEGIGRLDSLVYATTTDNPGPGSAGFDFTDTTTLYRGPTDDTGDAVMDRNSGLTPELLKALCVYRLNEAEVAALRRIGFKYVTQFTASAHKAPGGSGAYGAGYSSDTPNANADGTIPTAANGLDPLLSACLVRTVKANMAVAAITPLNNLGRLIYQACGSELMVTNSVSSYTDNFLTTALYNETTSRAEVAAAGGPLLAFGLGDNATIIGKPDAGLDSAPYATFPNRKYYSRYILLFRLKSVGSSSNATVVPEFAGVIDCCGNTVRAALDVIRNL